MRRFRVIGIYLATLLTASVVGVAIRQGPVFAEGTGCPSSGCVGAYPSDTNCEGDSGKYPIATALITWTMQTQNSRVSLLYSPLCSTYWGEADGIYQGYADSLMLFGQDQYGGREKLLYSEGNYPDLLVAHETKMVAAGPGSVKFCVADQVNFADPDLTPDNSSSPTSNCTDWR